MPQKSPENKQENHHKYLIISHLVHKVKSSRLYPLWLCLILIGWTLIVIVVTELLLSIIFSILFQDFTASAPLTLIYNALCYAISFLLLIFIPYKLFKISKPSRTSLGLANLPTFIDLGLAPVGFLAYYLLSSCLTALFTLFPWFNLEETQDVGFNFLTTGSDYIIAFLALVVFAPIAEELIFRGWLYGKLREKLPQKISLIVSIILVSALFGFMHGQWNVGINTFALSIVLCILREITGTIYSGIFLHAIKNAIAFYLVFIVGLS